jgi:prepilin-type N-terminal cleavage/methylation domain-containing protein
MSTSSSSEGFRDVREQGAFTLSELIVVMAVIGLLAALLVPAHSASRTKAQGVRCMDNLKQMMNGMAMYTHDYHDLFPPNPDDGTALAGYTWCGGQAGIGGGAEFNPDILASPTRCLIVPYIATNVTLFRCTADARMGRYQGSDPSKIGTTVTAARTISLSQAVGTIDPGFLASGGHSGVPNLPTTGPWLSGTHTSAYYTQWRTYGKISQMVVPGPSQLAIIMEEDPWSLNDGSYAVSTGQAEWIDYPSTLHNMGCVFSFGDGHAEFHKWRTLPKLTGPAYGRYPQPTDSDWNWVAARTSALR